MAGFCRKVPFSGTRFGSSVVVLRFYLRRIPQKWPILQVIRAEKPTAGGERSYHRCGLAALQKDGSKTVDFMSPTAFSASSSRNTYFSFSRQPAKMSSLSSLVKNGALLELLSMRSFEFPLNTTFQHYRRKEKQKKKKERKKIGR